MKNKGTVFTTVTTTTATTAAAAATNTRTFVRQIPPVDSYFR